MRRLKLGEVKWFLRSSMCLHSSCPRSAQQTMNLRPGPHGQKAKNEGMCLLEGDFPGGSDGKASAYNAGPRFDPWVGKIPWRREWQPAPVLLPGKSHGWRSLVHSMGSQRVGHDWATSLSFLVCDIHLILNMSKTELSSPWILFVLLSPILSTDASSYPASQAENLDVNLC